MYGVNISHTHQDLIDSGNGALKIEGGIEQAKIQKRVPPYLEIGETGTQLPNI